MPQVITSSLSNTRPASTQDTDRDSLASARPPMSMKEGKRCGRNASGLKMLAHANTKSNTKKMAHSHSALVEKFSASYITQEIHISHTGFPDLQLLHLLNLYTEPIASAAITIRPNTGTNTLEGCPRSCLAVPPRRLPTKSASFGGSVLQCDGLLFATRMPASAPKVLYACRDCDLEGAVCHAMLLSSHMD